MVKTNLREGVSDIAMLLIARLRFGVLVAALASEAVSSVLCLEAENYSPIRHIMCDRGNRVYT